MCFSVIYNFQHDGICSLKLEVGDTVHIMCQEENWYFGYSVKNRGLKGIYPKNYISIQESFVEKSPTGDVVKSCKPPIVEEVTSVVKEWGTIAQNLYVTHDPKWKEVHQLITELIANRSKILTGTLTLDELRELKQLMTTRIDQGNYLLKLDMVVRDDSGNIIDPEKVSVVHLYREHELASQRIKKNAAAVNSSNVLGTNHKIKLVNRHSHMFFVAVRNFVCRIGEDTELLMCLYDAKDWKSMTENYVVRWSRMGLAQDLDLLGNLRVLFTDLGSKDLTKERVYLVCQVVRVGNMEVRDDPRRGSSQSVVANARRTALLPIQQTSTSESLRRPCGVAAMDVTEFLSGRLETNEEKQHFVPFVSCGDRESLDSTLRRIVMSGREVGQKERKGQGLWISLRLLHGDLKQVGESLQSIKLLL